MGLCTGCSLDTPHVSGASGAGGNATVPLGSGDAACDGSAECGAPAEAAVDLNACGELVMQGGPCGDCVRPNCCAEDKACRYDVVCSEVSRCVRMCLGDSTCVSACPSQYASQDLTQYNALSTCLAKSCATDCK
jgi:hypothetical protein